MEQALRALGALEFLAELFRDATLGIVRGEASALRRVEFPRGRDLLRAVANPLLPEGSKVVRDVVNWRSGVDLPV